MGCCGYDEIVHKPLLEKALEDFLEAEHVCHGAEYNEGDKEEGGGSCMCLLTHGWRVPSAWVVGLTKADCVVAGACRAPGDPTTPAARIVGRKRRRKVGGRGISAVKKCRCWCCRLSVRCRCGAIRLT